MIFFSVPLDDPVLNHQSHVWVWWSQKDVDLPRICVVGKQSSGKSSVMEALTGHGGGVMTYITTSTSLSTPSPHRNHSTGALEDVRMSC